MNSKWDLRFVYMKCLTTVTHWWNRTEYQNEKTLNHALQVHNMLNTWNSLAQVNIQSWWHKMKNQKITQRSETFNIPLWWSSQREHFYSFSLSKIVELWTQPHFIIINAAMLHLFIYVFSFRCLFVNSKTCLRVTSTVFDNITRIAFV